MITAGFFDAFKLAAAKPLPQITDSSNPPVEGARLGRDKDGNPAWYIADERNPGKYLQVNTTN
jgi:hypothetical protein